MRPAWPRSTLALQHDKLPPSINYAGPNPYIDFDKEHLKVADTVTDWPRYSGHAIAGVSGFGFGGANAHLVVREVLPSDLVEPEPFGAGARRSAAADADAVYVGGVRMDEYGEFIHDDDEDDADDARRRLPRVPRGRPRTARPDRRGAAPARGRPRRTRSPADPTRPGSQSNRLCRWRFRHS